MTQKIFALATLALPFNYVTFSTENQAQTGDYGRWSEILTRGDPCKIDPSDPTSGILGEELFFFSPHPKICRLKTIFEPPPPALDLATPLAPSLKLTPGPRLLSTY